MIRAPRLIAATPLVLALALPGCQFGARRQLDECRRLSQALRSQNDQLKDQALAYRGQYEDAAERAVDDGRRLSQQEEAIERLERSVQAYQHERDELQTAFRELRDGLPAAVRAALASPLENETRTAGAAADAPRPLEYKASAPKAEAPPRRIARTKAEDDEAGRTGWAPASGDAAADSEPRRAGP